MLLNPDEYHCKEVHSILQCFLQLKVPKITPHAIYKVNKNTSTDFFFPWLESLKKGN